MSKTLQFRRYPTSNLASIIGASGELIVDTTLNQLTVHDGITYGGWYAANGVTLQTVWNTANLAYAQANTDITYLAANVANLLGIDTNVNANVILLQSYVNTANANIANLFGISTTTNTNITLLQSYITSANSNIANLFGIDTTTNTNITLLQSYITTANANIASLYGIETTQNTNITTVTSNVANLFGISTTTNTNITTLQSYITTANANIASLFGIEATQNNNIQLAWNQANSTTYYTNANAVLLLASFGSNTISTTGNVTAGNVIVSNTITTPANTGHSFFAKVSLPNITSTYDTAIAMDNLNVRVHAGAVGSNGVVQISPVAGSFTAYPTVFENVAGQAARGDTNAGGIAMSAGTWYNVNSTYNLLSPGDMITAQVMDSTNGRMYRVTTVHGVAANTAYIAIERMV